MLLFLLFTAFKSTLMSNIKTRGSYTYTLKIEFCKRSFMCLQNVTYNDTNDRLSSFSHPPIQIQTFYLSLHFQIEEILIICDFDPSSNFLFSLPYKLFRIPMIIIHQAFFIRFHKLPLSSTLPSKTTSLTEANFDMTIKIHHL